MKTIDLLKLLLMCQARVGLKGFQANQATHG